MSMAWRSVRDPIRAHAEIGEALADGQPGMSGELFTMKLRGVRKTGVDVQALAAEMAGFTFADAERVCVEAIKSMVLSGVNELRVDLLRAELDEQRARLRDARTVIASE